MCLALETSSKKNRKEESCDEGRAHLAPSPGCFSRSISISLHPSQPFLTHQPGLGWLFLSVQLVTLSSLRWKFRQIEYMCVCVYKSIYFYIWIIMRVKIQAGVHSCGASKPVYKHVCDSHHLFLSLALVSFPHLPLCVASLLSRRQHHHPAHPSPCVHFALSFLLLSTTLMSCCVLHRSHPLSFFRVLVKQWDGCHSILAVVQHVGITPFLAGHLPWTCWDVSYA